MKQLKNNFIKMLKSIYRFFDLKYQQLYSQQQATARAHAKSALDAKIYSMMVRLSYDLNECLRHRNYHNLNMINDLNDIRILNYSLIDGNYIFHFSLSKARADKISISQLLNIKSNMNHDIFRTAFDYRNMVPEQDFMYMFPFLCTGLQIASVEDSSPDYVVITVTTFLQP